MKRTIKQAFILSMIALTTNLVAFAQIPSVQLVSSENKTVGNKIEITATFNLSDLHLKGNRTLVIFPIIAGLKETPAEGKETQLPLLVINGYKRHILYKRNPVENVATEVKRHNSKDQSVNYSVVIAKEDWMNLSKINYYYDLCGCGNESQEFGYLTESYIPNEIDWIPLSAKSIPGTIVREEQAFIQFSLDKTTIDYTLGNNKQELDNIIATIKEVKDNHETQVAKIFIHGYGSPEGEYEHNAELGEARTKAVAEFVRERINMSNSIIETGSTPEDMDGLLKALQESSYDDREEAIGYIENETLTPDQKEAKIKKINGGQLYAQLLEEVLPKLRHTDYFISYNEMIQITSKKEDQFPAGSAEAINNQAIKDIKNGQINRAKTHFEKAAQMGLKIAKENLRKWGKIYNWN